MIVLKIVLLHSISVITNFVIPKREKQTDKKQTSHFLVYSRCATHDPSHTWHGDRGGLSHFCTHPTFVIRSLVSPKGAIENLWENAPLWKNAYNSVFVPESDQIKNLRVQMLRIS